MDKKITIKDIAKHCGIGLGTASRAINGKPGVRDAVRAKVLNYIEEIGWRSNNVENRMALPESGKTAIFVSSKSFLKNESDNSVSEIMLDAFTKQGIDTIFMIGTCSQLLQKILHIKPFCVVIVGVADFLEEHVKTLIESGIRVVGIGECTTFAGPLLHPDHYKAGYDAAKLLKKNGHKRIGFLAGIGECKNIDSIEDINALPVKKIIAGIKEVFPKFDFKKDVVSDNFYNPTMLDNALKNGEHTAWVCAHDRLCRMLLHEAHLLNLSIPQDISVVTLSPSLSPYLFVQDITRFEMDSVSRAQKAIELIFDNEMATQEYLFDFNFHKGETIKNTKGAK